MPRLAEQFRSSGSLGSGLHPFKPIPKRGHFELYHERETPRRSGSSQQSTPTVPGLVEAGARFGSVRCKRLHANNDKAKLKLIATDSLIARWPLSIYWKQMGQKTRACNAQRPPRPSPPTTQNSSPGASRSSDEIVGLGFSWFMQGARLVRTQQVEWTR